LSLEPFDDRRDLGALLNQSRDHILGCGDRHATFAGLICQRCCCPGPGSARMSPRSFLAFRRHAPTRFDIVRNSRALSISKPRTFITASVNSFVVRGRAAVWRAAKIVLSVEPRSAGSPGGTLRGARS